MAPSAKKPRVPSAYMVFTDEKRQEVQERLRQDSETGKVAAPAIAKALGELWKAMSEEGKDLFRQKSKERAAAAAAAAAAEADAAGGDQEQDETAAAEAPSQPAAAAVIPRHIVKRIMLTDDEVQRVSADALWVVAEAARLFLQQLAVRGAAAAGAKKRKTIKLEDFEHVVRCDKRLVSAGLKDVVNNKRLFELNSGGTSSTQAAGRKPGKAAAKPGGSSGKEQGEQQPEGEAAAADGEGTAEAGAAAAAGEDGQQQQQDGMSDEERIALEEAKRKQAAEAAKVRAAKATERKQAKEADLAKNTHKITTFFVSNRPDMFV